MTQTTLRQRTVYALSWSFVETLGVRGIRFIVGIILARLLFPEQFGLIGMLTIFVAVAQSFLDSGFGAALIQKRETTPTDTCSVFYFNILVGIVATGLLYLAAPWIASFYNQPILTPLTRILSLSIVINSFGLIQNTMLIKEINFKALTKVNLVANGLSGCIGIVMAFCGFGVWSLAVQQISATVLGTSALWIFNSWRPVMRFSFGALRDMFSFGSRMLASGLLNTIFDNIYLLVIGKLFSPADLGFFARASTFQEIPSQSLSGMVGRVTFPVFASIQDDPKRLKRSMKKALATLAIVNFPIMIGLAVIARPLVLLLLTQKWAESIPYLQLLCLLGLMYPLHSINLNLLQALGRSELFLRLEVIKKVLIIINIAVTWRWGITAMICGMIGLSVVSYYLNSYYTGVLIGYRIREQLYDLSSYLIIAVLMGLAAYGSGLLQYPNHWSTLLMQIVVGIGTYVGLCWALRLTAFMELREICWNKLAALRGRTLG